VTGNTVFSADFGIVANGVFTANSTLTQANNLNVAGVANIANLNVQSSLQANGSQGTPGFVLYSAGSGSNNYWGPITATTPPGGANTQVQFNDSNTFNGSGGFIYTKTSNTLSLSNTLIVGSNVVVNTSVLFVGNSTINAVVNSSTITIDSAIVINAVSYYIGANVSLNAAALFIGNTSINAVINSSTVALSGITSSLVVGNSSVNATVNSTVYTGTSWLANSASYVGSVSAANVVSNSQLSGNLANYPTSSQLTSNLANYYQNSNPRSFISGITSGMVTSALGYTPYNSSNPSGYISGITYGMVTGALGYTPLNSSNPSYSGVMLGSGGSGPGAGIQNFAHYTSGSYGGGFGLLDGGNAWGIYDVSGVLNLGYSSGGGSGALTSKMSLYSGVHGGQIGAEGINLTGPGADAIFGIYCSDTDSGSGTHTAVLFVRNGSGVGDINENLTSTTYATSSDRRLKENFTDSDRGLSELMKIRVREFNFKIDPGNKVHGFVAQELHEVYPEAVATHDIPGEGDLKEGDIAWSVEYGRLTPLIVKSIQDAYVEILALKAKNEELTALVGSLQATMAAAKAQA
jgi:endosialidase-like protein